MAPNTRSVLAWVPLLIGSTVWQCRGLLHPGAPILLDHPIHYAECLYLLNHLLPKAAWISGWCDLQLAGFPMLVTYSIFGYLPAAVLHFCMGVTPELAYKCAVFFAYLFAVLMLFVFLRKTVSAACAGICAWAWSVSPLAFSACVYGLWQQYWGIGFLLCVFLFCECASNRSLLLAVIFLLIGLAHVFSVLALVVFLVAWCIVQRRQSYHDMQSILLAASIAFLLGAFYAGPFFESMAWLTPAAQTPHIPFGYLARRVGLSLVTGSPALLVLAIPGLATVLYTACKKGSKPEARDNRIGLAMLLFLCLTLFASLAPWRYLPILKDNAFLASLHVHGDRSLLYAQLALAYFSAITLQLLSGLSRSKKTFAWVAVATLLAPGAGGLLMRPSPFLTMADLAERSSIEMVRDWMEHKPSEHRGLVQDTLGNAQGLLGQSHVMALLAFWTQKPQIGSWIGGTLYPQENSFLTESGRLFGKDVGAVTNMELLRQFQTHDVTWAVACEPRLKEKLETSQLFNKELEAGPFAMYSLREIFYNPAQYRADSEGISVQTISVEAGRIQCHVKTINPHSKFVIKQTYHPFWRAQLDNAPVSISTNGDHQIVLEIASVGDHELSLHFVHPKAPWPLISLLGALLFVFAWFFPRGRRASHALA